MFYLAIALIGLGLLIMFYIFLSVSGSGESGDRHAPVERPLNPGQQSVQDSGPDMRELPRKRVPAPALKTPAPSVRFQWVDTGQASPGRAPSGEQLIAEGVLFLDHGRQIHLNAGRFDRLDSSSFLNLKRAGSADMKVLPDGFTIHCGRASYRLSSESLEQILFLNGGIALVPSARSEAVVVFLTEATDRIREFVKKYSRLPSQV